MSGTVREPPLDDEKSRRLEALVTEYVVRRSRGEAEEPALFLSRYPDLRPDLERLLHDRMGNGGSGKGGRTAAGPDPRSIEGLLEGFPPKAPAPPGWLEASTVGGRVKPAKSPLFAGRFEILGRLGEGSFGVVYLARDRRLRREVALKCVRTEVIGEPDAQARFLREARALAAVSHPHVVTIYDIGETEDHLYLCLERIRGATLREHGKAGPFPVSEVVAIARDLLSALEAIHRADLVHRDIKPGNVMLDLDGRTKLMDFGLAKASHRRLDLTQQDVTAGTPLYMAPEQWTGKRASPQTDLFSLAVVLYEMLAGKPPFRGKSLEEVQDAVLRREPQPLPSARLDVPEVLWRTIERALRKAPEDRFLSAGEMRAALASLAPGPGDTTQLRSRARDHPVGPPKPLAPEDVLALVEKSRPRPIVERREGEADSPASPAATPLPRALLPSPESTATRRQWGRLARIAGGAVALAALAFGAARLIGGGGGAPLRAEFRAFRVSPNDEEQPIWDGNKVYDYDRIVFEVDLSDDAYVYLLNRDSSDRHAALFPSLEANFVVANPLPAGKHRFPPSVRGSDEPHHYELDDNPGQEIFLLMASREPSAAFESLFEGMRQIGEREIASAVKQIKTRGVSRLVADPEPAANARSSDSVDSLPRDPGEVIKEIWLKHEPK